MENRTLLKGDTDGPPRTDPLRMFPLHLVRLDEQYRVLYASQSSLDWFGLNPDQQTGKHLCDLIGTDAFTTLQPWLNAALSGTPADYSGALHYPGGGDRTVSIMFVPCYGEGDRVVGVELISCDSTERLATRAQLADETLRSFTIVQNAIDGIITIDARGIIKSFNPASERLLGYEAREVIGQNVSILMPEPDRSTHDDHMRQYQRTGSAKVIGREREVLAQHRNGNLVPIRLAVAEFFLKEQQYFVGFIHDVSEREKALKELTDMQERLAHADRVTAAGELASGLAHEISQPLTAIHATAEACKAMIANASQPDDRLASAMNDIAQQSRRASDIVQELRAFVHKGEPGQLFPHDPNALVINILPLLTAELEQAGIRIQMTPASPRCECLVNRIQIEQVFVNLLRNAIDAMKTNACEGTIEVRSQYRADTDRCEIEVEDQGPGIPSEYVEQIFSPFFTTKGHGLGQGLGICRTIIERHGGKLDARTPNGGGAIFRFTLPAENPGTAEQKNG